MTSRRSGRAPATVAAMSDAELFRLLGENVVDYAIFMVSPDGDVATWNAGAKRLKGYEAEEIIGRPIATFYPPEDDDVAARLLAEARAGGRAESEGWRVRKDGSRFWANVVLTALRSEDGALRGFAKITRDLGDRRAAELSMQDALDRQKKLLDTSAEETLSVDRESRILAFNQQSARTYREWTGVTLAVGLDMTDLLPAGARRSWSQQHEQVLAGETLEYEATLMVGGTRLQKLVKRGPIRANGEIVGETISARDITQMHEAAQQRAVLAEVMRLAERPGQDVDALYEEALIRLCTYLGWAVGHVLRPTPPHGKLASAGIWYFRSGDEPYAELRRVTESMEFEAGVGIPGRALALKDVVFHPNVGAERILPRQKVLAELGLHAAIGVPVLVEDEVVAVLELASFGFVNDPAPLVELAKLVAGQLASVIERERASTAIAFAESRFLHLFEGAPAGMALGDKSGRIVAANEALAALVGFSRAELRQRTLRDLLVRGEISPPLDGSDAVRRIQHKNGDLIDVELRLGALHDGIVIHVTDLTALKRSEEELRRSNEELELFAYAASHDLRAPLRAVRSLAGIIEEDLAGKLDAASAEHFELLRSRVARMENLLGALLEYSRAGRVGEQTRAADLRTIVDDAIALVPALPGFTIDNQAPAFALVTATVALERVLLNLIVNAQKHHDRDHGTITVTARDEGRRIAVDVTDDGPGIPAAYQERVFQMFQTLRARDEVEGSGMGLSLVKKIVETAGGQLTLVSEGRGCRFTFTWPKTWPQRKGPTR